MKMWKILLGVWICFSPVFAEGPGADWTQQTLGPTFKVSNTGGKGFLQFAKKLDTPGLVAHAKKMDHLLDGKLTRNELTLIRLEHTALKKATNERKRTIQDQAPRDTLTELQGHLQDINKKIYATLDALEKQESDDGREEASTPESSR